MYGNVYKSNKIMRPLISNGKILYGGIVDGYLFCLFVIPNYFGINLGFFDLTATRLFLLLTLYGIFISESRRTCFLNLFRLRTLYLPMYVFWGICLLTNVVRVSLNGIFNIAIDTVLVFFVILYIIKYEIGIENLLSKIRVYSWILGICGIIEAVLHKSPFAYLRTLNYGADTAERFGNIRICGPCTTSNGYGLYLLILIPLVCIVYKKGTIDILKNKGLFLLLCVNVFLTGTRLALGVLGVEVLLLIIFSDREKKAWTFIFFAVLVGCSVLFLILLRNTGIGQSILQSLFNVVDSVFGTSYAAKYGTDMESLYNSNYYRKLLPQIFSLDYLNPMIGRGLSYQFSCVIGGYWIRSIDNYYVGIFITYAYPGLVAFITFQVSMIIKSIKNIVTKRRIVSKTVLIILACYFLSLWYLDQLQTYRYVYILFVMLIVDADENRSLG